MAGAPYHPGVATNPGLVIVGAGGFGREAYDLAVALNPPARPRWSSIVFATETTADTALLDAPLLHGTDAIEDGSEFVVAIGDGAVRRRIATALEARGLTPAVLVHPTAVVGSRVAIGPGSMVCSHVSISTNITIGRHVLLNVNSTVGHDAILDDYATIGPGCAVTGGVRIGVAATLGARCAVIPRLEVGDGSMVPAGSTVVRAVAAGTTWGMPARREPALG